MASSITYTDRYTLCLAIILGKGTKYCMQVLKGNKVKKRNMFCMRRVWHVLKNEFKDKQSLEASLHEYLLLEVIAIVKV